MKLLIAFLLSVVTLLAHDAGIPYALDIPLKTKWKEKIPYIYESKLLYNSNTLYAIERPSNTISEWSLNPIKRRTHKQLFRKNIYNFWLGFNQEKMAILSSVDAFEFNILDLNKKKIVGTVNHNERIYNIALSNSALYTRDNQKLIQWELHHFKAEKKLNLRDSIYDNGIFYKPYFLMLSANQKFMVAVDENKILYIDLEKFKVIKRMNNFDATYYIGVDKGVFYYKNGRKYFKVDVNTFTKIATTKSYLKEHSFEIKKRKLNHIANPSHISGNKKYIVKTSKGKIDIFSRGNHKLLVTISLYKGGEWIAMTPQGYFDVSSKGREFLRINSLAGEPIGVNDIIFKRYHKTLLLDELMAQ